MSAEASASSYKSISSQEDSITPNIHTQITISATEKIIATINLLALKNLSSVDMNMVQDARPGLDIFLASFGTLFLADSVIRRDPHILKAVFTEVVSRLSTK